MKFVTLVYLVSISFLNWPSPAQGQAFSIGSFSIGQSSVELDLNDFEIRNHKSDIKLEFQKESMQWIRTDNNLLTPRILLLLKIPKKYSPVYIKFKDQVIFPVNSQESLNTKVYVNLFHPAKIQIYQNDLMIDSVEILAKAVTHSGQNQWVDHSCSAYEVTVKGVESEYSSTGCVMNRVGNFGAEKPRLEIAFSSPNFVTPSGDQPPFLFNLNDKFGVDTVLVNKITKEKKKISISANLPDRLYRLKTSVGVGPYFFTNGSGVEKRGPDQAPAIMLYGKYELTDSSSLRAFDALIYHKAYFNNAGLYFSYDLARIYDGKIILGALLGFQGLHYRYDEGRFTEFDLIYPQGFEATYNHVFGLKNHYLTLGMFASTTQEVYNNIWIRYGHKIFYEVNYINWEHDKSQIEMWGLSIGFPLFKAL